MEPVVAEPQEIELKFEVPPQYLGGIADLPFLKNAKRGAAETLRSVYFDTRKQKLRQHDLSLRLRNANGRCVQTVKRSDHGIGLFKRNEWEREIAGRTPDFDAAKDTGLGPVVSKKLRRKLKPLIETVVRRQVFAIDRGDSKIELTVDTGRVKAAGRSSPLCEIELELKQGKTSELFELARAVSKTVPVQLATKSKAERGYDLIDRRGSVAVKADAVALTPDADWSAAFQIIARACLYELAANHAALSDGDPEAVHQMRVAIRRLRAAISLFKDMLSGPQTEAVKSELKWLTGELGPARELDVFVRRVVKRAKNGRANGPGMAAVAGDFREQRLEAIDRAKDAVNSPRFRGLLLDASAWIEIGDWTRNEDDRHRKLRERSVVAAAAQELSRRAKKMRRQGAKLVKLDPRRRHKLRIRTKKLRYACEFFAGAFPGRKSVKRHERFVSALKAMLDCLGDLNDIVVHQDIAKRSVRLSKPSRRTGRVRKAFAAGRLSGHESERFGDVLDAAQSAYRKFAKARPFWT